MLPFQAADSKLFFSKQDKTDPRLGEFVTSDLAKAQFALCGYPDDEGISLNGGRVGASLAPDVIRTFLYKMTPHLECLTKQPLIFDQGNLQIAQLSLEKRHAQAQQTAYAMYEKNLRVISLGGGHDYGYADTAAFVEYCQKQKEKPVILNFDAHLDVRPTDRGLNSGTPFYRLLSKYSDLDFAEIGIQPQCNSQVHLKWAKERGARVIGLEQALLQPRWLDLLDQHLGDWLSRERVAFLSIDMDCFSSSVAMGCSQSFATGVDLSEFMRMLYVLCKRWKVLGIGIYEVSPPLDLDNRTAKLAAQIVHQYISQGL